jgi:hypothetical protein
MDKGLFINLLCCLLKRQVRVVLSGQSQPNPYPCQQSGIKKPIKGVKFADFAKRGGKQIKVS